MQDDRETTRFSRQQIVISVLALIVAIVAIVASLLNPEIRQWLGLDQHQEVTPFSEPTPTGQSVFDGIRRTPTTNAPAAPTIEQIPPKCPSMHLGVGKQLIVTIYNGCYYHFNIACAGCKVGEENNYVIYYAGSTTKVTVPDGSVWQYNSEPNQGEVCSDLVDHWPSNLPSFINFTGVQQFLPCGIR